MSDKTARLEDGLVRIDFPYDPRIVADIHERFDNAGFNKIKKYWYIDPDKVPTNALYLFFKKWYIIPEDGLPEKIADLKAKKKDMLRRSMEMKASSSFKFVKPAHLSLYPFQEAGIEFIIENKGNVLIADDMGLGKTVQGLVYARNVGHLPIVVVCPLVAFGGWAYESARWLEIPEDKIRVIGAGKVMATAENLRGSQVVIINYDMVQKYLHVLEDFAFRLLIVDECHYIKNYKAKRTEAVVSLSQEVDDALCLSGTPLTNKPIELYPMLQILKRDVGDFSFWNFTRKYCDAKKKWVPSRGGGKEIYDTSGASNLEELNEKLRKNVMLRRMKKDVHKELPPMRRMMVRMDLGEKLYRKFKRIEEDFISYYEETRGKVLGKGEKVVFIETMRKLSADGKAKQAIEFIDNLYQNVGKVIVFAHHHEVLDAIEASFSKKTKFLRIDGETTHKKRIQNVDSFNALDDVIMACSITASGTSLNLQTCSNVVFVEVTWVPADHQQAEARVHRIGQKEVVNIYYLIAQNTIEEKVYEVIGKKDAVIKKVVR